MIERESINKKTGAKSRETARGITSQIPDKAQPEQVLAINRGHRTIESTHYIIDWNFDEDRNRIRTAFGPENMTHLRLFAIGLLKFFQKPSESVSEMMRKLFKVQTS